MARLLGRAQGEIPRSLEAILSRDSQVLSDSSRALMEITVLFREWIYRPILISEWESVNERKRSEKFSFARVIDRVRDLEGISNESKLEEVAHYSFHSAALHPSMEETIVMPDGTADYLREVGGHLQALLRTLAKLIDEQSDFIGLSGESELIKSSVPWNAFIDWRDLWVNRVKVSLIMEGKYLNSGRPIPRVWGIGDIIREIPEEGELLGVDEH